MSDIIKRIDELAKKQNITFAALEKEIGIGRGTIRRWDENCPSADKLLRVANRLIHL